MKWNHSVRVGLALATAVMLLTMPVWAQQERTSENTPFLKKLLEKRPEADLDKDGILTGNIHHSNFGKHLKEAMDKLGIECVRRMDTDYDSMTAAHADMVEFVKRHFGMKKK